ncbi:MAG: putative transposase [Clostridiales bacterium]|nr:putative transposase [Clostridiales bacterium]
MRLLDIINLMEQFFIPTGATNTQETFHQELSKVGVTQSLSGVNHCYDNARIESFFAILKKELLYRIPTYKMKREDVKGIIFKYVFTYYNRTRVYTLNPGGYLPAVYRELSEGRLLAA